MQKQGMLAAILGWSSLRHEDLVKKNMSTRNSALQYSVVMSGSHIEQPLTIKNANARFLNTWQFPGIAMMDQPKNLIRSSQVIYGV